jgi:uncharacterized membrane protein
MGGEYYRAGRKRQAKPAAFIERGRGFCADNNYLFHFRHHTMTHANSNAPACQICHTQQRNQLRRAAIIRPALAQLIQKEIGHWDDSQWICVDDLQRFQQQYVSSLLKDEQGELSELDREVLDGLQKHEILSRDPEAVEANLSFGQRLADRIAEFGGSWSFIIVFALILFGWMALNSWLLAGKSFDPYPYILLNLVLSTLAAIQAPLIMMSQNRQEQRDRLHAQHDYQVNLKAELEIRQLHQKIDHLLTHQWERLVEIQEVQMELINEVRGKR